MYVCVLYMYTQYVAFLNVHRLKQRIYHFVMCSYITTLHYLNNYYYFIIIISKYDLQSFCYV